MTDRDVTDGQESIDVLIVGAGPTGLALAAQLQEYGTRFRIVDRALDRVHESRALAVQPRTLEMLAKYGISEQLVERGSRGLWLHIHVGNRTIPVGLFDIGIDDTAYPYLLFVSQAVTEQLIGEHLRRHGATIERGAGLVELQQGGGDVACRLRHHDGSTELVRSRYVVGCDGARSTVRQQSGIGFEGLSYPQTFVLADVEADGIEPGVAHTFLATYGVLFFFPLGSPATWRVLGMRRPEDTTPIDRPVTLEDVQRLVDAGTAGRVRLRDPVWMANFRLHSRGATHYRSGRVFVAGDAAHIHSPVGAQGMNTGIQDAWNLAWKLALVARGTAVAGLLDSYEAERWPVGRRLLRYTDRAFTLFTRAISGGRLATWLRRVVVARLLPRIFASSRLRAYLFHLVSQLGIRYRNSPAVTEGEPRLGVGPKAGDRFPDAKIEHNGRQTYLQQELAGASLHLLLCGALDGWDQSQAAPITARHSGLVVIHYLTARASPDVLVDTSGKVLSRLGVRGAQDSAQYLVRPDGHVGFRCAGRDLGALTMYLDRWLPSSTPPVGG